jgi:UDP-N-acetylglucosamine/UDP-N-acetylgalactosamine diphosphorylase
MTLAQELREALIRAGQGHVVERWQGLDEAGKRRLEQDLVRLDLDLLRELRACAGRPLAAGGRFEPPRLFPLARGPEDEARAAQARRRGAEALRGGRVGFVLVAGGQASRLGYDAPKGMLPIGPVTGRSLFAYHAHRLVALCERFGVRTPWYVMTSPENDAATRSFFEEEAYFGLAPEDVSFFTQDTLPALDEAGRVLFASRSSLFLAPNGHGGTLLGLARSGAIEDMRSRGVRTLSYFQVDNPLVRPADALFLGLHLLEGAEMSSKVVRKRDASEKVGVIGRIDGKLGCIEYSDLPA